MLPERRYEGVLQRNTMMLAGLMIASLFSGVFASGAAVVLGLPLWAVLLAYPLAGMLGLLIFGGVAGLARPDAQLTSGFAPMDLQPLPVRQRR
jgi:hypothetical protein